MTLLRHFLGKLRKFDEWVLVEGLVGEVLGALVRKVVGKVVEEDVEEEEEKVFRLVMLLPFLTLILSYISSPPPLENCPLSLITSGVTFILTSSVRMYEPVLAGSDS